MEKLLPREIEVDIFSRLPAETLLPSKRVCKTWRGLFFDDNFIDVHLRRQSIGFQGKEDHPYYHKGGSSCSSNNEDDANTTSEVSFLILGDSHGKGQTKSFYYGNYSDKKQQFTCKKLKAENNNQLFTHDSNYSVVGSCNGLICLSTSHISELFVSNDPVCVCNPITGEVLNLPNFIPKHQPEDQTTTVNIASGFGYVPLTNEYKVVRICYYRGTDRSVDWVPLRVQVCTLGSDEGWKTWKGDAKSLECLVFSDLTVSQGVYSNGALYWLNIQEDEEELTSIVVFDLAKEEFYSISPPPCFHLDKPHCYQLQVLGGCLSVVHHRRGEYVDIWSWKKTNNNSSQIKGTWSWSREFRIEWENKSSEYQPFALTKRGQVLLWYNRTICLYDANGISVVTELMDGDHLGFKDFQVIPHVNSFVSIKALGKG